MARYDRPYDSVIRFRPGREERMRGYDRSFGEPRALGSRPFRAERGGEMRGRYDREFRGPDRPFRTGYDDPFRPFREQAMRSRGRYDRPIRGSEPGGVFDPFTGPFGPGGGMGNMGAGRPRFFTDYGGGEQSGGRRGRGF